MSKESKKLKRLERGSLMYFINMRDYKVCNTADWYFQSDDERWASRNYFPDAKPAKECAALIMEEYGEQMETLESAKVTNKQQFIKKACDLANKVKGTMEEEIKDADEDKPKRRKKKPDFEAIAFDLVEARDKYEQRKKDIAADIADIQKNIEDLIKDFPR